MRTAYHFFYANAGWSYNPATETSAQGRARCAKALARAEMQALNVPLRYVWHVDPDASSLDFCDKDYPLWACMLVRGESEILASLCGIDFGEGGQPWGDPYRRVVEAELALEHFGA